MRSTLVYLFILGLFKYAVTEEGFCSAPSVVGMESNLNPLYLKVDNPTLSPVHLQDLPGFTRSVYKRDHALISPESHVYGPLTDWIDTSGAYLIAPAMGSQFVMYLAKLQGKSKSRSLQLDVERFIFVLQGAVTLTTEPCSHHTLKVDSYAYLPPNYDHVIECDASATIVVFERRYAPLENHVPELIVNSTYMQPLLETPGEVFELRKLLPTSMAYDFNIHIMDFQPGEFLNVKEVHYNQHGLLLLEGQGIYRLGNNWTIDSISSDTHYCHILVGRVADSLHESQDKYPVQTGDVIWMAPFVPQWYAALGKTRTRYLLYKDVNRNPL